MNFHVHLKGTWKSKNICMEGYEIIGVEMKRNLTSFLKLTETKHWTVITMFHWH